jgi:hypothetical protein
MDPLEFTAMVAGVDREAQQVVQEHLEDNDGELLLHLLVADLLRLAHTWFELGMTDALTRLLAVVGAGLTDGDEGVENAVAVSFVEDSGWWDQASQAFIAAWPAALQAEVARQRTANT